MRVVVTGATGYIGRSLCDQLVSNGDDVVALTRDGESGLFRCLRSGAVRDLVLHLDGADAVVHLAGRLVEDPSAGIAAYFGPNVELTEHVMNAASANNVDSVVHASTRLVYPRTLAAPALEDEDAAPDTPYGMSKRWAEDVVRAHADEAGMSALSLRMAQVTGGDHPGLGVINSFLRQARDKGEISVNGNGAAIRDIVHRDDVVRSIIAALRYRGKWLPVNIGGFAPVTIEQIARAVANAIGASADIVRHVPVGSEDLSCYALDTTRAHDVLDWSADLNLAAIIGEIC